MLDCNTRRRKMLECGITRLPLIFIYLPSFPSLVQLSFNALQDLESETRLSVLTCARTARRWCDHIDANALVDLSARNVAVLQVLEVDENLVWAREIVAGRTGEKTGRAGEADAKVSELGAFASWGEGKASGNRAVGDGGGVSLSVAECAVGSNKHLLAAGNDDVWTELASRGGREAAFLGRSRATRIMEGAYPSRQCRAVPNFQKRK